MWEWGSEYTIFPGYTYCQFTKQVWLFQNMLFKNPVSNVCVEIANVLLEPWQGEQDPWGILINVTPCSGCTILLITQLTTKITNKWTQKNLIFKDGFIVFKRVMFTDLKIVETLVCPSWLGLFYPLSGSLRIKPEKVYIIKMLKKLLPWFYWWCHFHCNKFLSSYFWGELTLSRHYIILLIC